ncbi:hypothetical protein CW751_03035 [Brumimicrobium salinarum]|uniref:Secretion system C-terminal sorting domain-containing protein n=1 Tax=Brumimicrobium salinarum TaxID=2058658 RepID=A0A2I0R6W1_9FLAO|nr:T9SS type A sorting domain-containing protein [Brumimicrobium salinarum]PKR82323.1 hypothetical protein CW751_03035 [Brumimicrobium salinarum]
MKKIYVMAAFLGAGLFASGQIAETGVAKLNTQPLKASNSNQGYEKALGATLYHENFDSIMTVNTTVNPADTNYTQSNGQWTIDNDGETADEFGWTIGTTDNGWFGVGDAFTSSSGNNYAQLNNGDASATPGTQKLDKVYTMTSGPIDIASLTTSRDLILTFEQFGALFNDKQYLEVSTDGTTWTEVYNNSDKEALTATGGSAYPNPEIVEVDISSEIAGQDDLYLRFGWTTDLPTQATNANVWVTYGWVIDDIKIAEKSDFDLRYVSSDHEFTGYQYSQVPDDQVSVLTVKSLFENRGKQDLTNVELYLIEGTDTIATSANLASLPAGQLDSLEITYTPDNTMGVNTYTLGLGMTETDDNPGNNSIPYEIKFDVNDFTYAADQLNFGETASDYSLEIELTTGSVIYNSVGIGYDMFGDKQLTGIDVRIAAGEGEEISVGVELNDGQGGYSYVAASDLYTIQSSDIGQVITIPLESPVTLNSGNTYRAYVDAFGNNLIELAAAGTTTRPAQITFFDGADYSYIGNLYRVPVIRLNFDPTVGIESNEMSNINIAQSYPNPFANETKVAFNLKEAAEVSYTVVDVAGNVVANVNEGNVMAGEHELTIDGSTFANGVYYLNIVAGDSRVTQKLVVNK